jgi:hypothetical protein
MALGTGSGGTATGLAGEEASLAELSWVAETFIASSGFVLSDGEAVRPRISCNGDVERDVPSEMGALRGRGRMAPTLTRGARFGGGDCVSVGRARVEADRFAKGVQTMPFVLLSLLGCDSMRAKRGVAVAVVFAGTLSGELVRIDALCVLWGEST